MAAIKSDFSGKKVKKTNSSSLSISTNQRFMTITPQHRRIYVKKNIYSLFIWPGAEFKTDELREEKIELIVNFTM